MIAPFKDGEETKYYLLTFKHDMVDNNVNAEGCTMEKIDVKNFMWNGKSCRLEFTT